MNHSVTFPVSIIIPARNEALAIGDALETAVASGAAEILVVDDESTDSTASLVRSWATIDARVQLLTAGALPHGWTGKNHALAIGSAAAGQPWLLFLDADTRLLGGGLEQVWQYAQREGLDALSLSPDQVMGSVAERAILPVVFAELARRFPFAEVNDPRSSTAAANGQFLLVSRAAYERIGGHEAVRSEVLEDVRIAERLKAAGLRYAFQPGFGVVRTRMYRSLGQQWEGWTKNLALLLGEPRSLGLVRLMAPAALLGAAGIGVAAGADWLSVTAGVLLAGAHIEYAVRLLRMARTATPWREAGAGGARWGGRLSGAARLIATMALYIFGATMTASMWLNSARRLRRGLPVTWRGRNYLQAPRRRTPAARAVVPQRKETHSGFRA